MSQQLCVRGLGCAAVVLAYLCALSHGLECANSYVRGTLSMRVNTKTVQVPIIQAGGSYMGNLWVTASNITNANWARAYWGKPGTCPTRASADDFWHMPLLGSRLGFTVDVSKIGCGCNAALYFNSMPGYDAQGKAAPSQMGDFYCDANKIGGVYCPEIDVMEANNRAWQTNPHQCSDRTAAGHYVQCDDGCAGNNVIFQGNFSGFGPHAKDYGPGPEYIIDTLKPIQVVTEFVNKSGVFTDMIVTWKQGSKSVSLSLWPGCENYTLSRLTQAVTEGMVLGVSNWGDKGTDMWWLDTPACNVSVDCVKANVVYSDIWLETSFPYDPTVPAPPAASSSSAAPAPEPAADSSSPAPASSKHNAGAAAGTSGLLLVAAAWLAAGSI